MSLSCISSCTNWDVFHHQLVICVDYKQMTAAMFSTWTLKLKVRVGFVSENGKPSLGIILKSPLTSS